MNLNDTPQAEALDRMVGLVNIALHVLSMRLLLYVTLALDAAAFGFALATESWPRLVIASVFAAVAWATINLKPPGGDHGS